MSKLRNLRRLLGLCECPLMPGCGSVNFNISGPVPPTIAQNTDHVQGMGISSF
jgi:hypothetical protein